MSVNAFVSNEVDRRCVLAASGFARAVYALAQVDLGDVDRSVEQMCGGVNARV